MLAVLRVLPAPKGYINGRRAKKGKIPLKITKKNVLNADFLEVYSISAKKGLNYKVLYEKIKPLTGHLVIEYAIKPPLSIPIKQYDDSEYLSRLMLNFVVDTINKAAKKKRITVMLQDENACCSGVAAELIKASAEVFVVTEKPKEYLSCVKYCYENFGAIVKLYSKYDEIPPANCIVAPYGMQGHRPFIRPDATFSGAGENGTYNVDKKSVLLPEDVLKYCGDTISPTAFAAALCEEEGVFSLLKIMPENLIKNGVKFKQIDIINKMIT